MPATLTDLAEHIDVIGMVKKSSKVFYRYNGHGMALMTIYSKLKKWRGQAKILASTLAKLKDGRKNKLVFVRNKRKRIGWRFCQRILICPMKMLCVFMAIVGMSKCSLKWPSKI